MISKGNHVKFARFMLLAVSEEAKTFFFVQCIIKQLLDSVFVISRIIKVSVKVISLSLRLRLITLTSTLIILEITKTSSNNCLIFREEATSSLACFHADSLSTSNRLFARSGHMVRNKFILGRK